MGQDLGILPEETVWEHQQLILITYPDSKSLYSFDEVTPFLPQSPHKSFVEFSKCVLDEYAIISEFILSYWYFRYNKWIYVHIKMFPE